MPSVPIVERGTGIITHSFSPLGLTGRPRTKVAQSWAWRGSQTPTNCRSLFCTLSSRSPHGLALAVDDEVELRDLRGRGQHGALLVARHLQRTAYACPLVRKDRTAWPVSSVVRAPR